MKSQIESSLRKSFLLEYQKLLTYSEELEAALASKDSELRFTKRNFSKLSQQLGIEMEIMKSDIQRLQREKVSLQAKLSSPAFNKLITQ